MTRYGSSRASSHDRSHARMRSCSAYDSSSVVNTNISTLSNQCTRKMPRVSLPYEPASRR